MTTCNRLRQGVTFIEMMVVMTLLALLGMMVIPAFQGLLERNVNWEADRLASLVHLLRNEAVLSRQPYRLVVDLDKNGYLVERRQADGGFAPVKRPAQLEPHQLSGAVVVKAVYLYGQKEPVEKGQVPLRVDPSGFMDPFYLLLMVNDQPYTLKGEGFTGKVELLEGHVQAHFEEEGLAR